MLIQSLFYGTIVGSIVGLVWAFSLNIKFSASIPIGAIVGLIVGLALAFFGKAAHTGGNITTGETRFVSGVFLTFLGIAGAAIGLLVWGWHEWYFFKRTCELTRCSSRPQTAR